jgi:hypothetical protein
MDRNTTALQTEAWKLLEKQIKVAIEAAAAVMKGS